jgi:hypothetical protein
MIEYENQFFRKALERLTERAKELNCIYHLEEVLKDTSSSLDEIFLQILDVIPPGWQHPTVCEARITFEGKTFQGPDFKETEWFQQADIVVDNNIVGFLEVFYTQFIRLVKDSQFMAEEQKLLNNIANRLGEYVFYRRLKKSIAVLQSASNQYLKSGEQESILAPTSDEHWKWRYHMAELIASRTDAIRFGVKGFYLIGSAKNAIAGPASDIDLMIHFVGTPDQRKELEAWIEGWSLCLSELNYSKTGYKTDGLIDLHIVTEDDIRNKSSFAVKIGAPSDGAHAFPLMK